VQDSNQLPELIDYNVDDIELRDRDAEMKEKGRLYADTRRGAKDSDIQVSQGAHWMILYLTVFFNILFF
jgi:hypothetical protein